MTLSSSSNAASKSLRTRPIRENISCNSVSVTTSGGQMCIIGDRKSPMSPCFAIDFFTTMASLG
eukprot:CAMPEP_0172847910 /NCGR_PEP_ID=MMETSP1075-20121228/41484_2 /TAXON_ID=2916 /ORGANISM="Ceratium fusus, Strain PA161109" /LENGTH=63 /DNA_ID=CAMNT_0013693061 /DNA_START=73 /DNA_END=260 /DNA_ORIENTATION=-